jgi:hypothetical protein
MSKRSWVNLSSTGRTGGFGCLLGVLALPLSSSGCTATAGVGADVEYAYDYPVYEVQTVPVAIEAYPRYYYRGSYVYLVDGRWYHQRPGGRWVVYREEPPQLRAHRVDYYGRRVAPPARRRATPGYAYPPPRRR